MPRAANDRERDADALEARFSGVNAARSLGHVVAWAAGTRSWSHAVEWRRAAARAPGARSAARKAPTGTRRCASGHGSRAHGGAA
jgi:hypothetical protein